MEKQQKIWSSGKALRPVSTDWPRAFKVGTGAAFSKAQQFEGRPSARPQSHLNQIARYFKVNQAFKFSVQEILRLNFKLKVLPQKTLPASLRPACRIWQSCIGCSCSQLFKQAVLFKAYRKKTFQESAVGLRRRAGPASNRTGIIGSD